MYPNQVGRRWGLHVAEEAAWCLSPTRGRQLRVMLACGDWLGGPFGSVALRLLCNARAENLLQATLLTEGRTENRSSTTLQLADFRLGLLASLPTRSHMSHQYGGWLSLCGCEPWLPWLRGGSSQ